MTYDLVIIGMGSAGITAAEFAIDLGLSVALVERAHVGGDCLWTACVPSKALLAAGRAAHAMRTADRWGIDPVEPTIDLARVWRRVRAVQAGIAAGDDDPQRFREMGAEVVLGSARLVDGEQVEVTSADGDVTVLASRFVLVCTGSRPRVPAIPGLTADLAITNERLFALDEPPADVAIIGGGPMAVETAQALRRLGVATTLFQRAPTLLPRDEPALTARLGDVLRAEGVAVHCTADVRQVEPLSGRRVRVSAVVGHAGDDVTVEVGGIVVATGRVPNVAGLGLAEIGVGLRDGGVEVDERGRTSVRTVYAAGDVTGSRTFSHAAGSAAVQAVRDMFFPGRFSVDRVLPWCTFTDPELAHVGLTVAEAEAIHGDDTDVWRADLDRNDRGRTDDATVGGLVLVTAKGKLVGAHVLAPSAGEMIHELAWAVHRGVRIDELAELPHVYPTFSSSIGRLAAEAANERVRRLKWMMKRR
jgi:pyruvate/2-oxoglutarate dehydrogenase complex dihydrolipoamide dehydrogenase (E3) component